jgi:Rap1a immunity proteins
MAAGIPCGFRSRSDRR